MRWLNFSLLILLVARFHVDVRHIYRASIAGKGPPLEALQALLVGCEVEVSALQIIEEILIV